METNTISPPPTPLYTTLQQVFDKIWQRFVVEGAPQAVAVVEDSCRYLTDAGNRCFIGACLPSDEIAKEWDMWGPITSVAYKLPAAYTCIFNGLDPAILRSLQQIHDFWKQASSKETFTDYCRASLTRFAAEHNLTLPQETPDHANVPVP